MACLHICLGEGEGGGFAHRYANATTGHTGGSCPQRTEPQECGGQSYRGSLQAGDLGWREASRQHRDAAADGSKLRLTSILCSRETQIPLWCKSRGEEMLCWHTHFTATHSQASSFWMSPPVDWMGLTPRMSCKLCLIWRAANERWSPCSHAAAPAVCPCSI